MRRRRKVIWGSLIFILGTFLWFVCVDRSVFQETCDACGYYRILEQYRLCGVPIHQKWRESESVRGLIARDLGAPCSHPRGSYYSVHCYRFWGLLFCGRPCITVTMSVYLDVNAVYNQEARQRVRAAATTNPALGEEFRQRVIYGSDSQYYREFQDRFGIGQKRRQESRPADTVGPTTAPEGPREGSGARNGDASLGGSRREKAEGEGENEADGPGSMNE